jgi:hypothetical protein
MCLRFFKGAVVATREGGARLCDAANLGRRYRLVIERNAARHTWNHATNGSAAGHAGSLGNLRYSGKHDERSTMNAAGGAAISFLDRAATSPVAITLWRRFRDDAIFRAAMPGYRSAYRMHDCARSRWIKVLDSIPAAHRLEPPAGSATVTMPASPSELTLKVYTHWFKGISSASTMADLAAAI